MAREHGVLAMTSAIGVFPSLNLAVSFPAVEAFPTSLSIVYLAGLEEHLDSETLARLKENEDKLRVHVNFGPILRARTLNGLEAALIRAFKAAAEYYVESGILIWRALNHDYTKLLRLSRISCDAIDHFFFEHARLFDRNSFIKAVAGIRILGKVGEWITLSETGKGPTERRPPIALVIASTPCSLAISVYTGSSR